MLAAVSRVIVATACMGIPAVAWALSLESNNLLELSRRSKFAVIGTVDHLEACPTELGHIFTYVTFSQTQTLEKEDGANARDAPDQFTLRVPSGMVDGMTEVVTDGPIFRRGERVILFLTRDPQQQVPIVNGANGVFLVDPGGSVRAYSSWPIAAIDRNFDVVLDPTYRPTPEDFRHWDSKMVAVGQEPERTLGLGTPPPQPAPLRPMDLDSFTSHLGEAWQRADQLGRLPEKPDY